MSNSRSHEQECLGHQIDEREYFEIIEKKVCELAKDIQPSFKLCHVPIDRDRALIDLSYMALLTLQIFNDKNRPMDEESIRERVLLIKAWENKLKKSFNDTKSFKEKMMKIASKGKEYTSAKAKRLRRLRIKNLMSQGELGKKFDISQVFVSQMENGLKPIPKCIDKWISIQ